MYIHMEPHASGDYKFVTCSTNLCRPSPVTTGNPSDFVASRLSTNSNCLLFFVHGHKYCKYFQPQGHVLKAYWIFSNASFLTFWLVVPYCPEQAPMGACSSSAKIWGWVVTRRTCLNGSTIPTQGPTPDANLAAMGLASSVCPQFVEASPTVEKAVSCYKAPTDLQPRC